MEAGCHRSPGIGHLRGEEKALELLGYISISCFELCLAQHLQMDPPSAMERAGHSALRTVSLGPVSCVISIVVLSHGACLDRTIDN